jgi:hypothetical protein
MPVCTGTFAYNITLAHHTKQAVTLHDNHRTDIQRAHDIAGVTHTVIRPDLRQRPVIQNLCDSRDNHPVVPSSSYPVNPVPP